MMDNEQPWQPLGPQQVPKVPPNIPQVPEVTLFSPSQEPGKNKTKFLQRAMANERILHPPNQHLKENNQGLRTNNMATRTVPRSVIYIKPSVPEVSLLDAPNPEVRPLFNRASPVPPLHGKASPVQVFSKTTKPSQFEAFGKHSVPDVTIMGLDPEPVQQENNTSSKFLSASYKKMLMNSHEHFMKQIQSKEQASTARTTEKEAGNPTRKSVFNQNYQANPLRKYAPQPVQTFHADGPVDGDTSSILVGFDVHASPDGLETSDETTFKKVAEMLSEIQKLVIPGNDNSELNQEPEKKSAKKNQILKKLAKTFLTQDEQEFFDVENEINEMEKES